MCNLGHAHTHRLRHHRMWISRVMGGARLLYLYLRVHTFYGEIIPPRFFPACRTKHRNKGYYSSMVKSMTVASVKGHVQQQICVVCAGRANFKENVIVGCSKHEFICQSSLAEDGCVRYKSADTADYTTQHFPVSGLHPISPGI